MIEDFDLSEIDLIAQEFANAYKKAIIDGGHNASGDLVNSVTYRTEYKDNWVYIHIDAKEYAKYLENGTKPHFPPIEAIKKWIKVKPILPRPLKNGKLPTENQLAYLISRKISRVGTKATNLLTETSKVLNISDRLSKAIINELTKQFNDENIKEFFK